METPSTPSQEKVVITPLEPPLSREEAQKAIPKLIRDFPSIVRSQRDPVIDGQTHSLVSFKMLPQPMKQDEHVIFGFFKVRGSDPTSDNSKMRAARIVQEVDSVHKNYVLKTGEWFPILLNPEAAVLEKFFEGGAAKPNTVAASIPKLSERLDKEAYQKHVQKIKQGEKELAERIASLTIDPNQDASTLEYYTSKRVGWIQALRGEQEILNRLNKIQASRIRNRKILKYLDEKYPQHAADDAWIKCWNDRGKKVGLPLQTITREEVAAYLEAPEEAMEPDDTPLPEEQDPELLPLESARWTNF